MSTYTDLDRERSIETHTRSVETHTMLKEHIKFNDERHEKTQTDLADHETRLRKAEGFRNRLIGWAVSAGLLSAGGAEILKAKIGM